MQLYGVMIVRNEADIVRINVLHHLAVGVDRVLVVDNGSTDGTDRLLEELALDERVRWTRWDGPFRQAEITTALSREAFLRGADWVLPIDADEFWWAEEDSLRRILETTCAGVLRAEVVNFVQDRKQIEATPAGLLHLTRRPAQQAGPIDRIRALVEAREIGFVEAIYPRKCVTRASLGMEIGQGNHTVEGAEGTIEDTHRIVCFHAPLRARAVLEGQIEHGRRVEALGLDPDRAWHVRRWARLADGEGLDTEWRANSYDAEGYLEINGALHPTVEDNRLRDAVSPWVGWEDVPRMRDGHPRPMEFELAHNRWTVWTTLDRATRSGLEHDLGGPPQPVGRRLERYEQGLGGLETLRQQQLATLRRFLEERDQMIVDLQHELHSRIGEASEVIGGLQAELQAKVAERDQMIVDLQAELQAKVAERDQMIVDLQHELHTKIGEANAVIDDLQAELQANIAERHQVTDALAQMKAKLREHSQSD